MTIEISELHLEPGMIARTLVIEDGKPYEVMTCKVEDTIADETAEFWSEILKEHPWETTVYPLVPVGQQLTRLETQLQDLLHVNTIFRRDLEVGDLYVTRSDSEETAAMEHQEVIESFKDGSVNLFTHNDRAAIFGPGQLIQ